MAILPLVALPARSLNQRSRDVLAADFPKLKKLAKDMIETMYAASGIGLAAPQIGKNIRLIVINKEAVSSPKFKQTNDLVLANPVITKKSWRREWLKEGCLSVPGRQGEIQRHQKVSVKARDLSGRMVNFEAEGLLAEVLQHEIDHLNGVLYIDKAKNVQENKKD